MLAAVAAAGDPPLPGRTRVPEGTTLVLEWSAVIDGTMLLHVKGRTLDVAKGKSGKAVDPEHRFYARLPKRKTWMYVEMTEGRGWAGVHQDPNQQNGYAAIVSVNDKGAGAAKIVVRVHYGPEPPAPPTWAPPAARVVRRSRPAIQEGRFWGERGGPVRSLLPRSGAPLFLWEGEVETYAVLALDPTGLALHDGGLAGARTTRKEWRGAEGTLDQRYVVLSVCDGPGRVRVLQRMNVKGGSAVLIELDDRDIKGAATYRLEGHAVAREAVDALYGGGAAPATRTRDAGARLWAIEKVCMERAYPGPPLNAIEAATLAALRKEEEVEPLVGTNIILAWPRAYLARTPLRWRFLAEIDAALDWLEAWTGKDQVAARGKRMISRFRTDQGGVALFVDFRLHIPRAEMRFPPDHGPYSHEVSHGFLYLPAISPTGRYNEGLTEVGRTSYWWFLGLEDAWRPFHRRSLAALRSHVDKGGTLTDVPSYGAAAGVYFSLLEACCRDAAGRPDWHHFARLLRRAREVTVPKTATREQRFELLAATCRDVFGRDATAVLEALR
ncbi:MAG: hypothetical protein ACYTDU_17280 [Planctomycetota bacterium]|jgi:hypothetical protein